MNTISKIHAFGGEMKAESAIARKIMTHNEAVAEVYRMTPQMKAYDEFMYLGVRWLPYTMFFHHQNYSSPVINTDGLGFRMTSGPAGSISVENFPEDVPVNILIGGSTALGTGTTCDEYSVASRLAKYTGEVWLNMGGRGYNAVQELILFLMHQHRFKKINRIVLLSGANTLTLEGLPDDLACEHGRYYYSYEFTHYMEAYNEDIRRRKNTFGSAAENQPKRGLVKRFIDYLKKTADEVNHSEVILSDDSVDMLQRVNRAAWVTTNALKQWKQLAASTDAKLFYVLQPMSRWTKDKFNDQEEEMFHAIDCCANNFWRLFGKLLAPELHAPYANAIADECRKIGIPFADMNQLMKTSPIINDNIYVDHLHFNDAGYDEVARLIDSCVINQQQAAAA